MRMLIQDPHLPDRTISAVSLPTRIPDRLYSPTETDTEAYADWAALSPALAADGYCVFALNYGGAIKEEDGDVAHETYRRRRHSR